MLIFGTFTGNIVDYATQLILYQRNNITEEAFIEASDKFMDDVTTFAIQNTLLGVAMLVLSYFTILLFNYSSLRQVRQKFNVVCKTETLRFSDIQTEGVVFGEDPESRYKLVRYKSSRRLC